MSEIYLKSESGDLYLTKNKISETKNTAFDTYGNQGELSYLDRHNIDCGDKAINNFILVNDGNGKFRYEYSCSKEQLTNIEQKYTPYNSEGVGAEFSKSYYLDKHNIDCGDKSLVQFNLNRDGLGKIRYSYKCGTSSVGSTSCRNLITSSQFAGNGNIAYLDRHHISCSENETLSQFNYIRPTIAIDNINYNYRCCSNDNDIISLSNTTNYITTYSIIINEFFTIPSKTDRIFIFDNITNNLLHVTDYIPKDVKSNIKITVNTNGQISSSIIYDKIILYNQDEDFVINSLTSQNGSYTAKQNPDGLVVITDNINNKIIWDSLFSVNYNKNTKPFTDMTTCEQPNCRYTLILQPDGNLVTYSDKKNMFDNYYVWAATSTILFDNNVYSEGGPFTLIMQDDGNLVLYNKNNKPYWSIFSSYNLLYNALIDSSFYIKWEITDSIQFKNPDSIISYEDITIKELTSSNGRYSAIQKSNGLIVIIDNINSKIIWDSAFSLNYKSDESYTFTACEPVENCKYILKFQNDGNLVTYSDKVNKFGNSVVWAASNTINYNKNNTVKPFKLIMQNDGNLVIYDTNNKFIWNSGIIDNILYQISYNNNIDIYNDIKEDVIQLSTTLNKTNRMFIYEKNSNKLLHITDYIPMSVKCIILINIKNKDNISSSVKSLNPLPVPNFSIDRNRPSNLIGQTENGVINRNFECPEGSIISRVHTEAGGSSHIRGIDSQCINPYTQQVTSSTIGYYGSRADYKKTCNKPIGFSRMYADACRYVHQVGFDDCYNGYNTDNSSSCGSFTEQNFNCLNNGKISRLDIGTRDPSYYVSGQLHYIKAYCSYPKI